MKQKITNIIGMLEMGVKTEKQAISELLDLFTVSKHYLLESILKDMDGKHPEYHREVVDNYLDDGC